MSLWHIDHTNCREGYTLLVVHPYHSGRWIIGVVGFVVILFMFTSLTGCGLRESGSAPQATSTAPIVHVTADQIAEAMQEDRFFADYGNATLVVQGIVSSVIQQNGDMIVRLKTSVPMKVLCHLGNHQAKLKAGESITVQSADAQRNGDAVGLWHCSVL